MNPSTALATVLVDELISGGVTDAVLCPGSRNAPLAMAMHAADSAGRIRLHVRIDERTAGFLAIGLARASGLPVPVVTTSGTAVANLHPAVLEAHHGGVPLLVLSADRPPDLRDVGANQVIDQRTVFGSELRLHHEFAVPQRISGQNARWRSMVCRALAACRGTAGRPGPVQLNLPLGEPLLPSGGTVSTWGSLDPVDQAKKWVRPSENAAWPEPLTGRDGPWTAIAGSSRHDVVVAGDPRATDPGTPSPMAMIPPPQPGERCLFVADLTCRDAGRIAAAGYPVIAEAGGTAGADVLGTGIHLLGATEFLRAHRPDRVIVLGRPTLFRCVTALLADPEVTFDVVAHPDGYPDITGRARAVAADLAPVSAADSRDGWLDGWRAADARARGAIDAVLADRDIAASPVLARRLIAALPPTTTLVLASSQTPRDVGMFAMPRDGVTVLANRGVAGIDGTVSTAVGVALAAQASTYALIGDLAFLHDLTGLVIGPHEPRPDLTIVVANNDGGAIFGTLEPGEPQHASAFERVFGTPIGATLAPIVEGLGAEHLLAVTADELAEALAEPPSGIRVVEVPVVRSDLRALLAQVREAVAGALAGL